jgi:hypothetical protein
MFSQVVNKAVSSTPFLHSLAERGVELDAAVENESSNRSMVGWWTSLLLIENPSSPIEQTALRCTGIYPSWHAGHCPMCSDLLFE